MPTREHGLIPLLVSFKDENEPPGTWTWIRGGVLTVLAVIAVLVILGATALALCALVM